ncbi:MAG: M14 family metallopeptidase [Anaerolineales bacterium]|jgi:hypothetical protein
MSVVLIGISIAMVGCSGYLTPLSSLEGVTATPSTESRSQKAEYPKIAVPYPTMFQEIPAATSTSTPIPVVEGPLVFGYSFLGAPMKVYRVGNGPQSRLLVGGLHGGYEGNTIELVQEFLDVLVDQPEIVPSQLTLYLVPCANPDGAAAGTDRLNGRMNGNLVDLNRNWDYNWQPASTHGPWPVSGGSAPFSEPESAALRDFILEREIEAVIFYHSAWAAVFPGAGTTASQAEDLALLMVEHTGYRYPPTDIDWQPTTGNAVDWLTDNGIPAIDIELSNHEDIDWDVNWDALMAFLGWGLQNED